MSRFTYTDIPDGISTTLGDELNSRFDAHKTIADLSLVNQGAWDDETTYHANDAVQHDGAWWVSLVDDNLNNEPAEDANWTGLGGSSAPTGAAGGVLGGTYPNPSFAVDMATQAEIDSEATTRGTADTTLQTNIDTVATDLAAHESETDPHAGVLPLDGTRAMTGDIDAGGFKVTNLDTPTASTDAATKAYADALASGLSLKASVKVATTANITLSGAQTIDSVAVIAGDRVLVKNQVTAADNGIYVAAAGAWSRATDADTSGELPAGTTVFVEYGATHQQQRWVMITPSITLDTTAQEWTQDASIGMAGSTAANGNSEGVGVWDSLSGTIDYFRGIASTNSFITVALNAGTKSIRLTLNEALLTLNNLLGTLLATKGGTGHATTTTGDLLVGAAANTWAKLAGNTTTTRKVLIQTGDGTNSAAPVWDTLTAADVPVSTYKATSTTSRTLSIGSKVMNTQTGLAYTAGVRVRISYQSDTTKWMEGVCTAYNSTTGQITVLTDLINGTGTYALWNLNITGEPGATGSAGTGDFTGPASSVDNALVRFDGTGGKTGQNSTVTLDDTGAMTFPEMAAPSTPASGNVAFYAKSDGLFYSKDDAGVETLVSGGVGGGGGGSSTGGDLYLFSNFV